MTVMRPTQGSGATAWLTTFTDLVALLLAFFVLLFSMMRIEYEKWQGFSQSLSSELSSPSEQPEPRPSHRLDLEATVETAAVDLDYLSALLRSDLQQRGGFADLVIRRRADHIWLALPSPDVPAEAAGTGPDGHARSLSDSLGTLLGNVDNRVEVVAYAEDTASGDGLRGPGERALARALAFAEGLRAAGYHGAFMARARLGGASADLPDDLSAGERAALSQRLEIRVMRESREPRQ